MNHLKKLRLAAGMPQGLLAVKSHTAHYQMTMIECYDYCPGPGVRGRIAKALNTTEAKIWPRLNHRHNGDTHA